MSNAASRSLSVFHPSPSPRPCSTPALSDVLHATRSYDNDNDLDVIVSNTASSQMYENLGGGLLSERSWSAVGFGSIPETFSPDLAAGHLGTFKRRTGLFAAFADVDGDGDREEPISKASKEKKEKDGGKEEKSDKDMSKVPPQLRKHMKKKMSESQIREIIRKLVKEAMNKNSK